MSTFTPGPWEATVDFIDAVPRQRYRASEGDDFHSIARAFGPNVEANARLIAAAPEMLEALRPFAKFAEKWDAKPLKGIDDEFYSIHCGEDGASLRLSECRKAAALLAKIDGAA